MVAGLAIVIHADPLALRSTLFSDPDFFDSLWYSAFPPKQQEVSDIDRILNRKS